MLTTIKHQDTGKLVVIAKCLTGYIKTSEKISDADSYIKVNGTFDAEYVAYTVSWQTSHGCTPDGIIGPATWTAIAKSAPTCSTAKNRTSGYTFALQLLLDGNITADAIYGPRTKAAVVALQSATGLSSDGICGPKTWAALESSVTIQLYTVHIPMMPLYKAEAIINQYPGAWMTKEGSDV
jgi:peptidoglycan hydrolase-like protein with peptidoglycan-binding domain